MAISNFPTALQDIIQTGYLEHRFTVALQSLLRYRMVAQREPFPVNIGETLTKTKMGLLSSVTTPLNPTQLGTPTGASNLDNGLTPDTLANEQYTITINEYAKTLNLNIVGQQVGVVNQFVYQAYALGENAARSMDELARNALFNAYLGGNTRVRTTLGGAGPTISVDDVRGFQFTAVNGVQQQVSGTYPISVTVGSNVYSITQVAVDGSNVSTASGGVSGTLTASGNITVNDGTALNAVVAATAPAIIRPNARQSTAQVVSTDLLTMANLLDAKAYLEKNSVPRVDGFFHCYLDPVSSRQLFMDPDFKILFQGATAESMEFKNGMIADPFLGIRFMPTTEAFVQAAPGQAGQFVRRPIVCGAGALIEGDFAGDMTAQVSGGIAEVSEVDGVMMITRPPLDRLQQNVTQSWTWIGGFCAPTDLTTSPTTIATATNAAFKRGVVIEHIG